MDPCAGERASGSGDPGRGDGVVALVTGGAGFIGSHLADELLRLGYRVRVLDNLSTGKAEYVDSRVDFIDGDVRDADAVNRAMRPWGAAGTFESPQKVAASVQSGDAVAVVFHLAAMSKVGPSLNDPDMVNFCVENNVVGTENVLRAALRVGTVRKVIYAASSTYYGNQPAPFAETLPMEISSPYAVTKHQGELLMRVYDRVHDLPTVNLRFFMVYGERQPTSGAYAVMTGIFSVAARAGRAADGGGRRDALSRFRARARRGSVHVAGVGAAWAAGRHGERGERARGDGERGCRDGRR